jgi:hypothetical protein
VTRLSSGGGARRAAAAAAALRPRPDGPRRGLWAHRPSHHPPRARARCRGRGAPPPNPIPLAAAGGGGRGRGVRSRARDAAGPGRARDCIQQIHGWHWASGSESEGRARLAAPDARAGHGGAHLPLRRWRRRTAPRAPRRAADDRGRGLLLRGSAAEAVEGAGAAVGHRGGASAGGGAAVLGPRRGLTETGPPAGLAGGGGGGGAAGTPRSQRRAPPGPVSDAMRPGYSDSDEDGSMRLRLRRLPQEEAMAKDSRTS